MNIHILFGTESGNSELVACDVSDAMDAASHDVEVTDLADFDPAAFESDTLYFVICSTHGEGELPQSAIPFAEAMQTTGPDLTGVTYAVFGLGDSTYPNYSRGSERVDALLRNAGAHRVGAYGRHDAAGHDDPSETAVTWAHGLLGSILTVAA